jgi:hypothetical protein
MIRPAILIAEPEPDQALSVRKLVVETAKFNVLTAHTVSEGEKTLEKFPALDAVVVHHHLRGHAKVLKKSKEMRPGLPTILISPRAETAKKEADHAVSSHEPQKLVELLRELLGDPRKLPAQQE